jgi:hypothetical protein
MIAFFFCYQRLFLASVFLVGLLSRGGFSSFTQGTQRSFRVQRVRVSLIWKARTSGPIARRVSEATVTVNLSKNAGESLVETSRDSSLLTQKHKNCSSSVFAPFEGRVYYV